MVRMAQPSTQYVKTPACAPLQAETCSILRAQTDHESPSFHLPFSSPTRVPTQRGPELDREPELLLEVLRRRRPPLPSPSLALDSLPDSLPE